MVDPKAELMLARLGDPGRSWFRHKATGKIRDATDENVDRYEAMCKKRPGSVITWEKLTRDEAETALVEAFRENAQSIVDQAKAAPMETAPAAGGHGGDAPVVESLDS